MEENKKDCPTCHHVHKNLDGSCDCGCKEEIKSESKK